MVNVRLSGDVETRLEALSKVRNKTPHYLMQIAIERFLDVEETLEAERQLVLSRWEQFAITGRAWDHDYVKAWAGGLHRAGGS